MIFVGFGFLMTFLKRYSYSALGLNFFCSCIVMLEAILVVGAVQQVLFLHSPSGLCDIRHIKTQVLCPALLYPTAQEFRMLSCHHEYMPLCV